jgi:NitT/TauT family transport system substrate-binding protein
MYAQCAGLFEENRLDVSFEATQGSAPALNTVIAGGALLTRVGDIEAISAIGTQDAPLVNVGTAVKKGTIRMVSAQDGPLEEPEDFAGTLVGLPALGGGAENQLDLMLTANGLAKEDVERQVTGLAPGVFDLVTSGRIDGFAVSLDTAVSLQAQQPEAVVMDPAEFMSAGTQAYVTAQDQLDDPAKADQVNRYLEAIADAMAFVAEDEANGFQETLDCITAEFEVPAAADEEVAREALAIYVDAWTADGAEELLHTDSDRWVQGYEEMVEADLVPSGLAAEEWLTDEFAPGDDE